MRILLELATLFAACVAAFVLALASLAVRFFMGACFIVAAGCSVAMGVSLIMFWLNHSPHFLTMAFAFFCYAALAFALPMMMALAPIRLKELLAARRMRSATEGISLDRISRLRLKTDARFHENVS